MKNLRGQGLLGGGSKRGFPGKVFMFMPLFGA